jgi:hypothetical protein
MQRHCKWVRIGWTVFRYILPTKEEKTLALPGDVRIKKPTVVIDSAFDLPASPEVIFPWFRQLGKQRAGWYFPRSIERFIPTPRRGLHHIEPKWQNLEVGQRIPDYGGKKGYLECFYLKENEAIGYTSTRGNMIMTWVLTFRTSGEHTRVVIRLSMKTARSDHSVFWSIGKFFDRLTIAGLRVGLNERLKKQY